MWRSALVVVAIVCLTLVLEVSRAQAEPLAEMALAAKGQFRPLNERDLQQRKTTLVSAIEELQKALDAEAEDEQATWKTYLKWDSLQGELAKEAPDLKTLQGIRVLYYTQQDGLERAEFRAVRDALTQYMYGLLIAAQPDVKEDYESRLDDLAQRLTAYAEKPTRDDASAIGNTLAWLERAGQAKALVTAVRDRYWQPNLFAAVSQDLLSAGFEQDVSEAQSVRECILGTSVHGTAQMDGKVRLELVPNDSQASLNILLEGEAHSRNTGYNGPVTIYSNGYTEISANKSVHIDDVGMQGEEAAASCWTRSTIHSIAARCRLIRRVAWKRARQMKSQAERIASQRAASRVRRRFDEQATEMLDEANTSYADTFRNPLLRRDGFPNLLKFRTTQDRLLVRMLRAGASNLASPGKPPQLDDGHDLAVQVHDSLVENFSEALLSGETVSDEDVVELFEKAELEIPEELLIGPEKDPWSITFADERPFSAEFTEAAVKLALQGKRFTRGEQAVRADVRISADYKIEAQSDGHFKLTRQGDVQVDFPGRPRLSTAQVAQKTFLRRKFDALFESEIVTNGLKLPGQWEKAGTLDLTQLRSGAGWLTLGWRRVAEPESEVEADQVASVAR